MNNFVVENFITYRLVTFYTVRWEKSKISETDKFIIKYRSPPETKDDFDEIITLIDEIGKHRGAKDMYFKRHAGAASELPPLGSFIINSVEISYFQNSLRLFCIKISENIVILFNGGKKTSLKTQNSPELNMYFQEAQIFSKKIFKAIQEKDIIINQRTHKLESAYDDEICIG